MDITQILKTVELKKNKTVNTENNDARTSRPLNTKKNSNIKIMRLISHLKDIKDEKVKEKIVNLYYSQAVFFF